MWVARVLRRPDEYNGWRTCLGCMAANFKKLLRRQSEMGGTSHAIGCRSLRSHIAKNSLARSVTFALNPWATAARRAFSCSLESTRGAFSHLEAQRIKPMAN
jgi:hypothetical protein